MTNLFAIRESVNGARNLILDVEIAGDGASGEIDDLLVEVGAFGCDEVRLDAIQGNIIADPSENPADDSFTIDLFWDGPTQVPLFTIPSNLDLNYDWSKGSGKTNEKVAGYTGDVRLVTNGLGSNESASLRFHFIKKRINPRIP